MNTSDGVQEWRRSKFDAPLLCYYAVRCQTENIQASVSYQTEVRGACNGYARIEEWRVLDAIAVEALCSVLQHGGGLCNALRKQIVDTMLLQKA